MKSSRYNKFIPLGNSEYILYNFLHDSASIVDMEVKNILEDNRLDDDLKDPQIERMLLNCGAVVSDSTDECSIYLYKYNKAKYAPKYSLFVVLTTFACNLSCPYCYEDSGEVLNETMDEKTLYKVIDFIKKTILQEGTRDVVVKLYGGEPLLYPDLCYAISKEIFDWGTENELNISIVLQTNGTLLDEKVIEHLTPYLAAVEVTLDGPINMHNETRRYKTGGGSYEDILRNISLCADIGINVILRLNVNNSEDLGSLLNDLTTRGLKELSNVSFYTAKVSDFGP